MTASRLLIAALTLLACAGCSDSGTASDKQSAPVAATASHVIVLVMENKERGDVLGSRSAPFVNSLARRYAAPKRYYGIRHPSLPNYLALIGGSTFGIHSDCTGCVQNRTTLVDQLERAGLSWRAYMEGLPRRCYRGGFSGRYAKKHNPFFYFSTIVDRPARCANVVSGSQLDSDVRAGKLADFSFITPDLCNDTHDCSVAHGDRYLSKRVPPLLQLLGPHGFLVLTWEEGDSNAGCCSGLARGGRVPVVIAGPDVRRGARPGNRWSHYSTLRTVEDAFGLTHLRNAGASATRPLDAAFTSPPRLR